MAVVVYPLSRLLDDAAPRGASRRRTPIWCCCWSSTFLCAAATEHIGIHAAFGAFIAGTMFRQVPTMTRRDRAPARVVRVPGARAGVLRHRRAQGRPVDARRRQHAAASCWAWRASASYSAARSAACWGGMRFWEALSIAVAMNARGAMELVVATIGLSLGILNQQMFSIIVVVAIATSFMAPLGLRLTMKKVRVTEDEARRMIAEQTKGVFDPGKVRVLLPSGGGPNTPGAALLVAGLTRRSANPVELMHVAGPTRCARRLARLFRARAPNTAIDEQTRSAQATAR